MVQPNDCNECHDVLLMSINLNDISILNIQGVDYRCIITESDALNSIQNADLTDDYKH